MKNKRRTTASTWLGYVTILAGRRYAPRQESRQNASQVKQMLGPACGGAEQLFNIVWNRMFGLEGKRDLRKTIKNYMWKRKFA